MTPLPYWRDVIYECPFNGHVSMNGRLLWTYKMYKRPEKLKETFQVYCCKVLLLRKHFVVDGLCHLLVPLQRELYESVKKVEYFNIKS